MARVRKRGKTWTYEIKKTSHHRSYSGGGFKTKKEAAAKAKEIEMQLSSGQLSVF